MTPNTKMRILVSFMAALALAAGHSAIKEYSTMAHAEKNPAASVEIPLIDQRAPAKTETATFALG